MFGFHAMKAPATPTGASLVSVDGRAMPPPAWWDLPPDARELAFDLQTRTRELERAADPKGRSGTVRAVLQRLGMS